MAAEPAKVALIDDHGPVLDSLELYLRHRGFAVTCFDSAELFLNALETRIEFDCVVTDVRMPRINGLQLQQMLTQRSRAFPIIMITGHGDIAMAVTAVKAGAFDFIEKPIDEARLAASISEAVKRNRDLAASQQELAELTSRFADLSERQRQVVDLAVEGLSNKEIAFKLGISPRTVEHYRESAMARLRAERFAELIHMVVRLRAYRSAGAAHATQTG